MGRNPSIRLSRQVTAQNISSLDDAITSCYTELFNLDIELIRNGHHSLGINERLSKIRENLQLMRQQLKNLQLFSTNVLES